jgi:hypothetical protein
MFGSIKCNYNTCEETRKSCVGSFPEPSVTCGPVPHGRSATSSDMGSAIFQHISPVMSYLNQLYSDIK